ncbi:MAG TPA: hypothetical protein VLY63_12265 [Anaerolineae bacterium]|nr:hypothetical protein [Anaerolineae bacterium]
MASPRGIQPFQAAVIQQALVFLNLEESLKAADALLGAAASGRASQVNDQP